MDQSKQIHLTYLYVRVALAVASIGLPIVLILGGWLTRVELQATLSNYYFAELPAAVLRTAFVCLLFVIGVLLIIYRGYTDLDNWLHNAAGVAAFAVALFPMECPFQIGDVRLALCVANMPKVHYPAALIMFGIALASIWFGGGKAFRAHACSLDRNLVATFDMARAACAGAILSGVLSAGLILLLGARAAVERHVWWIESLAFLGFGSYWLALTWLVERLNAVTRQRASSGPGDAAAPDLAAAPAHNAAASPEQAPVPTLWP